MEESFLIDDMGIFVYIEQRFNSSVWSIMGMAIYHSGGELRFVRTLMRYKKNVLICVGE